MRVTLSMERAPKECVCCGRTERILLIKIGEWTVHKCSCCGLGVLDPRPDPGELSGLYRESYFVNQYDAGLEPGSPQFERRISQEGHRVRFFRPYRDKGLVVDIGCGRGYFLHACRLQGYDVSGIDISGDAAAYVGNNLHIPVKTGSIREDMFHGESVDIITLWHSLEHTGDPGEVLDLAWKWLRRDGILVIEVPNHEGTDARKKMADWEGWQLPYHLYHFTPGTLKTMIVRHGFQELRSKHYHSEYMKAKLRKIPLIGLFARPIAKFYSSTSYAILAKKAEQRSIGDSKSASQR